MADILVRSREGRVTSTDEFQLQRLLGLGFTQVAERPPLGPPPIPPVTPPQPSGTAAPTFTFPSRDISGGAFGATAESAGFGGQLGAGSFVPGPIPTPTPTPTGIVPSVADLSLGPRGPLGISTASFGGPAGKGAAPGQRPPLTPDERAEAAEFVVATGQLPPEFWRFDVTGAFDPTTEALLKLARETFSRQRELEQTDVAAAQEETDIGFRTAEDQRAEERLRQEQQRIDQDIETARGDLDVARQRLELERRRVEQGEEESRFNERRFELEAREFEATVKRFQQEREDLERRHEETLAESGRARQERLDMANASNDLSVRLTQMGIDAADARQKTDLAFRRRELELTENFRKLELDERRAGRLSREIIAGKERELTLELAQMGFDQQEAERASRELIAREGLELSRELGLLGIDQRIADRASTDMRAQLQAATQLATGAIANPFGFAALSRLGGIPALGGGGGQGQPTSLEQGLAPLGFQLPEGAAVGGTTPAGSLFSGGIPTVGALNQINPESLGFLQSILGFLGIGPGQFAQQAGSVTPGVAGRLPPQLVGAVSPTGRR